MPADAVRAKLARLRALLAEMPPLPWEASEMGPISGNHYWMEFGSVEPDIPIGEIEREQWDTGRKMVDLLNGTPAILNALEALLNEREAVGATAEWENGHGESLRPTPPVPRPSMPSQAARRAQENIRALFNGDLSHGTNVAAIIDAAWADNRQHKWGTDGKHSNEFCKHCFADRKPELEDKECNRA